MVTLKMPQAPRGSQRTRQPSKRLIEASQSLASPPATAKPHRGHGKGGGRFKGGARGRGGRIQAQGADGSEGGGASAPFEISSHVSSSPLSSVSSNNSTPKGGEGEQEVRSSPLLPPPSNQQQGSPSRAGRRGLQADDEDSDESDKDPNPEPQTEPPHRPNSFPIGTFNKLMDQDLKRQLAEIFEKEEAYDRLEDQRREERWQPRVHEDKEEKEAVRAVNKKRRDTYKAVNKVNKQARKDLKKAKEVKGVAKKGAAAHDLATQQARELSLLNSDPLEAVAFTSTWKLNLGRSAAHETRDFRGPSALGAFSIANEWAKAKASSMMMRVTHVEGIAQGYHDKKKLTPRPQDLLDPDSFRSLIDHLAQKCIDGATDCTINITFSTDRVEQQARGTATEQGYERLSQYLVEEQTRGDFSHSIRPKWLYEITECDNHPESCF